MRLELVFVEDGVSEVRADEHVNVEVNEGEHAGFEPRRRVDVAVEAAQTPACRLSEAEDAVPAVSPVKFAAERPGLDGSE